MRVSIAAGAALLVAACGSQGGNNTGAAGEGGGGGQGARTLQPGEWEMTSQMASVEIPGAPPEVQAQMRAQQGRTQTDRTCITPDQASNPLRQLRETMTGPDGPNCQTSEDTFAGGIIRIRTTCRRPGNAQGSAQLAVEGTFTATTLTATVSINAQGANVAGPGTTAMRVSTSLRGRRIGDCPANAQPRNAPPGTPAAPAPLVQPGNGQ
jgi:hypothetical protein